MELGIVGVGDRFVVSQGLFPEGRRCLHVDTVESHSNSCLHHFSFLTLCTNFTSFSVVQSMTKETRRSRQRQELVDDVVSEALRLLEQGGPTAVTLRGIAREVGVTAPALYTYFPSLAELFTELIVRSYRQLEISVSSALDAASDRSLEDRLAVGPVAYRQWAIKHRQQFNLIFFDQIAGYAAPPDGPTIDAQTNVLKPIAAEFAAAQGRTINDVLNNDELLDNFLAWWGAFHGIVALEVNHHLDWRDPEAIFLRHLDASILQLIAPSAT